METFFATTRRAVFRLAEASAALSALYHRARLLGTEHLPAQGPVLLVGNHGVWGYETPAFFHLVHQATPMTHTPLQWNVASLEHPDAQLPERFALLGSSFDYLEALKQLQVPTLIIHGARDTLVPLRYARDVARLIPGDQLEVLREASHLPYMSHSQAFNAFVGDFLLQHLS